MGSHDMEAIPFGAGCGAGGLSPLDLICGPEGAFAPAGGVLSNVWTGITSGAGDLRLSLAGSRRRDRDRDVALMAPLSFAPARGTVSTGPRPDGARDSLSPFVRTSAAELSTPGLRLASDRRCGRPWITSEMISAPPMPRPIRIIQCHSRVSRFDPHHARAQAPQPAHGTPAMKSHRNP